MKPLKLLYVHALPVAAGAANAVQVLKMCQALSDCGVDVTLAVPESKHVSSESEHRTAIHEKLGHAPDFRLITYKKRTVLGRMQLLGGYFSVKSLLQRFQPDVVFLRNVVFVRAAVKTKTPFIYEAHNSLMHNTSAFFDRYWTNYMLRAAQGPLMRKFITISEALADYWKTQGIPDESVIAAHDGFDANYFKTPLSIEEARTQLALPKDKRLVLYMGSLYADRGIERIIDLAAQTPEAEFLIVGGSERDKNALLEKVKQRDQHNIRVIGSVEHKAVATYLFAADILLMIWSRDVKTIDYCSPLKLFEYMAAGRTIVGHGFRTIREVLTHGENAYLVDPDSDADLLKKLHQALAEIPNDYGERARLLAFEHYSWEKRTRSIIASLPETTWTS